MNGEDYDPEEEEWDYGDDSEEEEGEYGEEGREEEGEEEKEEEEEWNGVGRAPRGIEEKLFGVGGLRGEEGRRVAERRVVLCDFIEDSDEEGGGVGREMGGEEEEEEDEMDVWEAEEEADERRYGGKFLEEGDDFYI